VLSAVVVSCASAGPQVETVDRPDVALKNDFFVGNRAPLAPAPLIRLPVGAIEPRGWVRKQLELQAEGFIGRLTEISQFLIKKDNAWLSPEGKGDHGWEEVPYWLKGFGDTGYLLGDKRIIDEAKIWIEGIFASRRPDGYFGPFGVKRTAESDKAKYDLWPNMVALFALQSYHDVTGDARVPELMKGYFRWELALAEEEFLPPFWQQQRAADNMASVFWLYNRTGEPWLLELADKIHRRMARWDEKITSWHNVNIAQGFDSPGIYFLRSKDPKHLEAAERNWRAVRDIYGQVPGGMFGSDENCRPGFVDPRQAIETCGMVEEMLSDEQLLAISADPVWADRCEDVAFNSLPASMTPDLKALHYLTAPNMPLCDRRDKSPGLQNGGPMLLFDPRDHRCCQHNTGHGWPYYAQHLWMATPGNGLAAVLYAPCKVRARVGDGTTVTITEETRYPFEETIELKVAVASPVRFPLFLRVPGWCERPALAINGSPARLRARPRSYLKIDRAWADGDRVTLTLPMKTVVTTWAKNMNSVSVSRGPLTFSLKIGEQYVKVREDDPWPAWEIHPTTPWNYGLVVDEFEVVRKPWPGSDQPFEPAAVPIELRARGRRIPGWKLDARGLVEKLQPGPIRSSEPIEPITLIPMGAARIRISAFPAIGDGPDAKGWGERAPADVVPTASHCWQNDQVEALNDGVLPKNSIDHDIPRFTWWDHRGTVEWVQYDFAKPRSVSSVEVYWFDDTGIGACRVPASWRLLYRDGTEWKPVAATGAYGTARDAFNAVSFAPVTTSALRIEAQLQSEVSAGILEWRVK
jgi:hypothetical protein